MSTPAHPRPPLRPDAGGYTHQDHYWTHEPRFRTFRTFVSEQNHDWAKVEDEWFEHEARAKVKREKLDPILLMAFEKYEEPPVPTLLQVLDDVVVMLVKPACPECGGEKFVPCEVETATGSTPCPYILEPCPVCNKEDAP